MAAVKTLRSAPTADSSTVATESTSKSDVTTRKNSMVANAAGISLSSEIMSMPTQHSNQSSSHSRISESDDGYDDFDSSPKRTSPRKVTEVATSGPSGKSKVANIRGNVDQLVNPQNRMDMRSNNGGDQTIHHRFRQAGRPINGSHIADDDYSVGNASIANTVASSTCGDARNNVESQSLVDQSGKCGIYTGDVLQSTNMPHGVGTMIYHAGFEYSGEWRHGRWHGSGKFKGASGDTHEGEYRSDKYHGRGKYCWSDGRVYEGEFSEHERHGKGTYEWPNGDTYTGNFSKGVREGNGRLTYFRGGFYDGNWKNGRFDGDGGRSTVSNVPIPSLEICRHSDTFVPCRARCARYVTVELHRKDDSRYVGQWQAGIRHGFGVDTNPDGSVLHDGVWIEGEPIPD